MANCHLLACSHSGVQGAGTSSCAFSEGTKPHSRGRHPYDLITCQRPHLLMPSRCWVRTSTCEYGGTQTFGPRHLSQVLPTPLSRSQLMVGALMGVCQNVQNAGDLILVCGRARQAPKSQAGFSLETHLDAGQGRVARSGGVRETTPCTERRRLQHTRQS